MGVKTLFGEFIVGDGQGVWKTRTMRRRPLEERWDSGGASMVVGVPWKTSEADENADGEELPPVIARTVTEEEKSAEKDVTDETAPRNFKISKDDLTQHGYTQGCPGCRSVLQGAAQKQHTGACRTRMEKAMQDNAKVKRARAREFEC